MKDVLIRRLQEEFSWLPRWNDGNPPFRYYEIDDGWYKIVRALCHELESTARSLGVLERLSAMVIRQKWGRLDFGVSVPHPAIQDILNKYEEISMATCERCGEKATLVDIIGVVVVVCNECLPEVSREMENAYKELEAEREREEERPAKLKRLREELAQSSALNILHAARSLEDRVKALIEFESHTQHSANDMIYLLRKNAPLSGKDRRTIIDWHENGQMDRWRKTIGGRKGANSL